VIKRDEFLQLKEDEQIACVYQAAKELSICEDLLIGLEDICTKSPPWLADFVIEHWMNIHNEKFKSNTHIRSFPIIQDQINNHRFFEQLPELAIQKIIFNITDSSIFILA